MGSKNENDKSRALDTHFDPIFHTVHNFVNKLLFEITPSIGYSTRFTPKEFNERVEFRLKAAVLAARSQFALYTLKEWTSL